MELLAQHEFEERTRNDISLKSFVVEEVRSKIMHGHYALGQRLSQSTLAREMNTSRAPVQDALVTLSHEGLVKIVPQKGSFVFNPTQEEIFALYELNSIYEIGAMELAMKNNYHYLINNLEKSLELMQNAENNAKQWVQTDRLFHSTFIESAKNAYLLNAYKKAIICTMPLVFTNTVDIKRMRKSFNEHNKITTYLKEKKISKAIVILRKNNIIKKP